MRQIRVLLFLTICLFVVGTTFAGEGIDTSPTDESHEEYQTYIVKPNDTLFLIAAHFNTTPRTLANLNHITNPNLIITGQELKIPIIEPSIMIPNTTRYTVQRGETLAQIAKKFETSIMVLRQLNSITNQNLIFAGQIINVPLTDDVVVATPTPTEMIIEVTPDPQPTVALEEVTPLPTETPVSLEPEVIETVEFIPTATSTPEPEPIPTQALISKGIEIYFEGQDIDYLVTHIQTINLEWVRVRVDWRHIEREQGVYDFVELDTLINMLNNDQRHILLTITNAPAWARSSTEENGPPADLSTFGTLVEQLLIRYDPQISAYQIWDEPNLRRNWNCDRRLCDTSYVELLQLASTIIWNHNPNIKVISAGLAPTRFNDSINAIDDRVFLQTQLDNGLGLFVDGIGIHPGGEANPPDAICCDPVNDITSHYEDEVFYFLQNLQAYHQIMMNHGLVNTPLWVTKFGWGTGDDVTQPSNPNQPHYSIRYTSLTEQAIYIPRALELAQELGYVEAIFINNLNGCDITSAGGLPELCYPSLIGPDGSPRPVYTAVQGLSE